MLNRISGWLLFSQVSYLALLISSAVMDVLTRSGFLSGGIVAKAILAARTQFGMPNTAVRLSDYIVYPLALSAALNLGLLLIFFLNVLLRRKAPSWDEDFFSICNTIYMAASGWVLFSVFLSLVHQ